MPLGHTPMLFPDQPGDPTKYPRGDSNSGLWLRRPALYPLSYGGNSNSTIPRFAVIRAAATRSVFDLMPAWNFVPLRSA